MNEKRGRVALFAGRRRMEDNGELTSVNVSGQWYVAEELAVV